MKVISRSTEDFTRERSQDLQVNPFPPSLFPNCFNLKFRCGFCLLNVFYYTLLRALIFCLEINFIGGPCGNFVQISTFVEVPARRTYLFILYSVS